MENPNTFMRYELKYLISKTQRVQLKELMSSRMMEDVYGRSTVCNVYFDTPDNLLIRHSLEKPLYKEKLRVRSYGVAEPNSEVYVEMKRKFHGIVYKRRVEATQKEAQDYLEKKIPLSHSSQVTAELDYFVQFYKNLKPKIYISYEREAFLGTGDKDFRVTFDENIQWRDYDCSLCMPPSGKLVLPENMVLMEIKVSTAIPLWLTTYLSKEDIRRTPFSKYGEAYKKRLAGITKEEG